MVLGKNRVETFTFQMFNFEKFGQIEARISFTARPTTDSDIIAIPIVSSSKKKSFTNMKRSLKEISISKDKGADAIIDEPPKKRQKQSAIAMNSNQKLQLASFGLTHKKYNRIHTVLQTLKGVDVMQTPNLIATLDVPDGILQFICLYAVGQIVHCISGIKHEGLPNGKKELLLLRSERYKNYHWVNNTRPPYRKKHLMVVCNRCFDDYEPCDRSTAKVYHVNSIFYCSQCEYDLFQKRNKGTILSGM